ncbi:hypothetical protein HQ545_01710 [Candidatus Woesearchaeota archaeon]|nr:hypothetical protein [Candidatus Woesearchaeota archaeon]
MPRKNLEKILEALDQNMSTRQAAKHADVSKSTVNNCMKDLVIEANYPSIMELTITDKQEERVYKAHSLDMSIREAADYAGVGVTTVCRKWKKKNLKPNNKPGGLSKLTTYQKRRMREAYNLKMSTRQAADYAKVNRQTVLKYRKKYKDRTTSPAIRTE